MPNLPITDANWELINIKTMMFMFCFPRVDLMNHAFIVPFVNFCKKNNIAIHDLIDKRRFDVVKELDNIVKQLIDAPNYEDLIEQISFNASNGAVAGDILRQLFILKNEGKNNPSLYNAYRDLKCRYDEYEDENRQRCLGWSEKKMKKSWQSYKQIAPLWAAFHSIPEQFYETRDLIETEEYVIRFFFLAEKLSDFGENLLLHNKSKKIREPLFEKDEVYRAPSLVKSILIENGYYESELQFTVVPPPPESMCDERLIFSF